MVTGHMIITTGSWQLHHGYKENRFEIFLKFILFVRAQELCESRAGRPGLPVLNKPYGFCGRKATRNRASLPHLLVIYHYHLLFIITLLFIIRHLLLWICCWIVVVVVVTVVVVVVVDVLLLLPLLLLLPTLSCLFVIKFRISH